MTVESPRAEAGVVRAPYQAPTLSAFGPLTRLTAGGSANAVESAPGPPADKRP